ncbi:MAG: C1 family peptidase [Candidatus Micrarchaeia archaeon]
MGWHAVLCVGYDDALAIGDKAGAFLIHNSWDEGWREKGYGWLPYDYLLVGLAPRFELRSNGRQSCLHDCRGLVGAQHRAAVRSMSDAFCSPLFAEQKGAQFCAAKLPWQNAHGESRVDGDGGVRCVKLVKFN